MWSRFFLQKQWHGICSFRKQTNNFARLSRTSTPEKQTRVPMKSLADIPLDSRSLGVSCWLVAIIVSMCGSLACDTPPAVRRVVGTLERDRIELIAEAQEPIVEILVREGQQVQTGDLLVRLDESRFAAQHAQAQAARDRTAARLAELVRGPRTEKIAEARARLQGVESTLREARRDLTRIKSLFEQEVVPEARLDQALTRYDGARSRRNEARVMLQRLLEGTTSEELDQARAAVSEAEAALTEIQIRAQRLHIQAPQPGQIDALPYEVGERPPPGAVVVVMLGDTAPYARVYVPEPRRVYVQPGLAAQVWVDGMEQALSGRVRVVSSEAAFTPFLALTERDRSRLTYVAEVDMIDPQAATLPTGLPVEVSFESGLAVAARGSLQDE